MIRHEQIPHESVYNVGETSVFFTWKKINSESLKTIVFNDYNKDDKCNFKEFRVFKKEAIFSELLEYAKTRNVSLDKADFEEIFNIDDNVLIIEWTRDSELHETVTQNDEILNLWNLIQKSLQMMTTFTPKILFKYQIKLLKDWSKELIFLRVRYYLL